MRIVFISDTHNKLSKIAVPDGDMLIHCGDVTMRGDVAHLEQFNRVLGALPHRHKIFVAGNHDFPFEQDQATARALVPNAIYLEDELIEIGGLRIYGSPWQPEHKKLAFNLPRTSPELKAKWAKMPDKLDILVTHGPPQGIRDWTPVWPSIGDAFLLERVLAVRPRIHAFGHAHHAYGMEERDGIIFVNAASLNENYSPQDREPIVLDI